ncbi:hypothetical protein NCS52_01530100 [Fusarium sp. LHS14.1]|nr:hypothetical protein NCS52_01530100 [Fusarium sp. LHS14.1]
METKQKSPKDEITNLPDSSSLSNSNNWHAKAESKGAQVVLNGQHAHDGSLEKPSFLPRLMESWAWEFLALFVSAGALGAMAAVINHYDRRPMPTWWDVGVEVSLNSLVSWIGQVASIGAGMAVGSGIAQLKWVWFAEKPRKLADMSVFSGGSGGLQGAAELIYLLRVRHVAVLGALAVILTIAFDPFTQNLIEYYDGNIPDELQVARLASNSNWTSVGPQIISGVYSVPLSLKGNTYNALLFSGRDEVVNPQVVCPTGNCTWDPFSTIAFQARCTNISSLIRNSCSNSNNTRATSCRITIQGSPLNVTWYWLGDSPGVLLASRSLRPKDSVAHQEANITNSSTISNVFQGLWPNIDQVLLESGGAIGSANTTFSATECALLPAVQRIRASVDQGVYKEEIVDVWTEVKESEEKRPDDGLRDFVLTPPWADGKKFRIRYETLSGLSTPDFYTRSRYLDYVLAGSASTSDANSAMLFNNDYFQSIYYANLSKTCDTPEDMYGCAVKTVAKALTKSIRDAPILEDGPESVELAAGTVFITTTFIRVHWAYMSLHLIVWAFSAITWLVAVWLTLRRKIPFWRDSPLPLMFLYQDDSVTGNRSDSSNSALDKLAENTLIKLNADRGRHGAFLESHAG